MGDDWVVDSLLGFLQSATWRCPVDTFIEQNSTVFDTEDENKFVYTEIHSNYREMVDKLLEGFTADLSITPQQLADACSQSGTLGEGHQSLFEQVLATEDFLLFKSIMVHKNIDLELQALKLMQRQLGHAPEAYQSREDDSQEALEKIQKSRRLAEEEEERILREVLEQSKKEYEKHLSHEEDEMQRQLQLAKKESLKSIDVPQREEGLSTALQKKLDLSSSLPAKVHGERAEHDEGSKDDEDTASKSLPEQVLRKKANEDAVLPPLTPSKKVDKADDKDKVSDAASLWLESAKADVDKDKTVSGLKSLPPHPRNMQDLRAREAYLRQQRDHLIKIKNKSRAERVPVKQPAKSSPSKASLTGEQRSKDKQTKESLSSELETKRAAGKGEGGKQSNSGVLCSAIADKLMMKKQ